MTRRSYPAYVADPGGAPRRNHDVEQSQRFGGDGFSAGIGAFGILQRQYENRYVAGGYRAGYGDHRGYSGPADYSGKQRVHEGEYWHGRDNPLANHPLGDTGTRRWEQGPFYGALRVDDESSRRRRPPSARTAGPPLTQHDWGEWHPDPSARGPGALQADAAPSGPHRAPRGPKGYRRSDARILEEVCARLAQLLARFDASLVHQHLDPSDVTVSVHDAIARLEGTVAVRGMKYHIEDVVAAVPGVRDVENCLRVPRLG